MSNTNTNTPSSISNVDILEAGHLLPLCRIDNSNSEYLNGTLSGSKEGSKEIQTLHFMVLVESGVVRSFKYEDDSESVNMVIATYPDGQKWIAMEFDAPFKGKLGIKGNQNSIEAFVLAKDSEHLRSKHSHATPNVTFPFSYDSLSTILPELMRFNLTDAIPSIEPADISQILRVNVGIESRIRILDNDSGSIEEVVLTQEDRDAIRQLLRDVESSNRASIERFLFTPSNSSTRFNLSDIQVKQLGLRIFEDELAMYRKAVEAIKSLYD